MRSAIPAVILSRPEAMWQAIATLATNSELRRRLGDAARDEIAESRDALRNMLGVPIEHFAYPFGDFTADTVELVRRAGYTSAVTVLPGVARASDDRLRLPRILVNGERGLWNFLLHVATPYERLRYASTRR